MREKEREIAIKIGNFNFESVAQQVFSLLTFLRCHETDDLKYGSVVCLFAFD